MQGRNENTLACDNQSCLLPIFRLNELPSIRACIHNYIMHNNSRALEYKLKGRRRRARLAKIFGGVGTFFHSTRKCGNDFSDDRSSFLHVSFSVFYPHNHLAICSTPKAPILFHVEPGSDVALQ